MSCLCRDGIAWYRDCVGHDHYPGLGRIGSEARIAWDKASIHPTGRVELTLFLCYWLRGRLCRDRGQFGLEIELKRRLLLVEQINISALSTSC